MAYYSPGFRSPQRAGRSFMRDPRIRGNVQKLLNRRIAQGQPRNVRGEDRARAQQQLAGFQGRQNRPRIQPGNRWAGNWAQKFFRNRRKEQAPGQQPKQPYQLQGPGSLYQQPGTPNKKPWAPSHPGEYDGGWGPIQQPGTPDRLPSYKPPVGDYNLHSGSGNDVPVLKGPTSISGGSAGPGEYATTMPVPSDPYMQQPGTPDKLPTYQQPGTPDGPAPQPSDGYATTMPVKEPTQLSPISSTGGGLRPSAPVSSPWAAPRGGSFDNRVKGTATFQPPIPKASTGIRTNRDLIAKYIRR
jgi:hypothetical protein